MFTMITGICLFRIAWVYYILPLNKTLGMLIVSYPVSWIALITINGTILFFALKKLIAKRRAELAAKTAAN